MHEKNSDMRYDSCVTAAESDDEEQEEEVQKKPEVR
jgi:hypothetical protein